MNIIVKRLQPELWLAWFEDYPNEAVSDGTKHWVIYRLVMTKGHLVNMEVQTQNVEV